jgi:hypothetical protein
MHDLSDHRDNTTDHRPAFFKLPVEALALSVMELSLAEYYCE